MPSKIDIWMPFFIGDYLSATSHLQTPQHGAYMLLLFHQWKSGKGIPGNVDEAIQIARARPFFVDASSITQAGQKQASSIRLAADSDETNMLRAWMFDLLDQFFVKRKDGRYENPRGARERELWRKRQETYGNRAKTAAQARWRDHVKKDSAAGTKKPDATSIAPRMLKQSPSPSPVKNKSKNQRTFGAGSEGSVAPVSGAAPRSPAPGPKKAPQRPEKHSGGVMPRQSSSSAAAVPLKKVARGVKNGGDPRKRPGPPDVRFAPFHSEIRKYWSGVNREGIGVGLVPANPPWGTRERVELNTFLRANPAVMLQAFSKLLMGRAKSHGVVQSDPPFRWIKDLLSYANGPLNKFKQPL